MWIYLATVILLLISHRGFAQDDPCVQHTVLDDAKGLYSAGRPVDSNKVTCMRGLEAKWYRFNSPAGEDMPTQCVEMFHCRTRFPFWLLDGIPAADGQIHDLRATATGIGGCAAVDPNNGFVLTIRVKNCGNFRVYYLTPTPMCDAAYCFGTESPCPEGETSETGFTPGCRADALEFSADLNVGVKPVDNGGRHEIQFQCIMSNVQITGADQNDVVYDVIWFIIKTGRSKEVYRQEGTTEPFTAGEAVVQNYKGLDVYISCNVRARINGQGPPTGFIESSQLFIGAKYKKNAIVFPNVGGKAPITIVLQVPFVCNGGPDFQCTLDFEIVITKGRKMVCKNRPQQVGFKYESSCKAKVAGLVQGKPYPAGKQEATFNIYANAIDVTTGGTYTMDMILRTPQWNFDHGIWGSYTMPPLTVTVVDILPDNFNINLANSICYAHNDPHMNTFDGCKYENHIKGEFIMYRHKILPFQVNIFTSRCTYGIKDAYCTQSVAIVSGRSHYIWDKTKDAVLRDTYLDCDPNYPLSIAINGNTKTVTFKSGTQVKIIQGFTYHVNVRIIPSMHDVGQTEGLCQMLDSKKEVYLFHPDGITKSKCPPQKQRMNRNYAGLEAFIKSWRSKHSLYNYQGAVQEGKLFADHPGIGLCDCECPAGKTCPKAECDTKKWQTECNPIGANQDKVYEPICWQRIFSRRRKRDTGQLMDDYSDNVRPAFSLDEPDVPDKENNHPIWSFDKAKAACTAAILNGTAGQTCLKLENLEFEAAVDNCIADIVITDSALWLEDSVDSMKSDCEIRAVRNFTGWETDSDGRKTGPPTAILDVICPGNCNNHGKCKNGECHCYPGFGAEDCSINMTAALNIHFRKRNMVVCDTEVRLCKKTPVNSLSFAQSKNLTCKAMVTSINKDSYTIYTESLHPAEYLHREEIMCPLLTPDLNSTSLNDTVPYAHIHNITVSNDGTVFSNSLIIQSYPVRCLECDFYSCSVKQGWCYIKGKCYRDGDIDQEDDTLRCETQTDRHQWSPASNNP